MRQGTVLCLICVLYPPPNELQESLCMKIDINTDCRVAERLKNYFCSADFSDDNKWPGCYFIHSYS